MKTEKPQNTDNEIRMIKLGKASAQSTGKLRVSIKENGSA